VGWRPIGAALMEKATNFSPTKPYEVKMTLIEIIKQTLTHTLSICLMRNGDYRVVLSSALGHKVKDFENSPRAYKRALAYALKLAEMFE
jgi:hypothetical protein